MTADHEGSSELPQGSATVDEPLEAAPKPPRVKVARRPLLPRQSRKSVLHQRNGRVSVGSPGGHDRPRTGLRALKSRVAVRGLAVLDKRTAAARVLMEFRRELLADLGGLATVSASQAALVELAARTRLYVDHIDAHLLEQTSLITRKGRLKPLVEQRQRLADSLARLLGLLGLERREPPAPSLEEYVRDRYSQNGGERQDEARHEQETRPVDRDEDPPADDLEAAALGPQV